MSLFLYSGLAIPGHLKTEKPLRRGSSNTPQNSIPQSPTVSMIILRDQEKDGDHPRGLVEEDARNLCLRENFLTLAGLRGVCDIKKNSLADKRLGR